MDSTERASYSYPSEFLALAPRELARLSQTNVTTDAALGLQYAAAAYDRGLSPAILASDPTLAGEAAAKAGFRSSQLDQTVGEVMQWFGRSYDALSDGTVQAEREWIATGLLEGRAFALRALRNHITNDANVATAAFDDTEIWAQQQHKTGRGWDPYTTMLSRHRATHEAVSEQGTGHTAAGIALRGIWRAARAQRETANTPEVHTTAAIAAHAKFVGKQMLMNTAALSLALSRPFDNLPRVAAARRAFAAKLLS